MDHIDDSTLNNIRKNLRIVDHRTNTFNINTLKSNNTSGYCGVSYDKGRRKWGAQVRRSYKIIRLGFYEDIRPAVVVRRVFDRIIAENLVEINF